MSAVSAEHPRCAVVLCSYNGERFLPAQLASLKSQTVQPAVYVLSDDASTDGTWALLQAFASERHAAGCEVVLHRNDINMGYVRHFEQALQQAVDVEVLFPCDQDDVWHPDKLERMLAVFAARPELLVLHGNARLIDGEGRDLGRRLFDVLEVTPDELIAMHSDRAFNVLLRRNIVTGATMGLRSELVEMARPFSSDWAHDEWLSVIAAMQGEVDSIEVPVIDYRLHGGNQIGVNIRSFAQRYVGVGMRRRTYLCQTAHRYTALLNHVQVSLAHSSFKHNIVHEVRERKMHAEIRVNLPRNLFKRFGVIIVEWKSGRYHRYGSAWRSAVVDFLRLD